MSLKTFLNIPDVREMFSKNIPKPKIKIESDILAHPLTTNYTIVGVAFDYLLRMFLKKLNKNAIERIWIAENLLTNPMSPILEDVGIDSQTGEIVEYKENEITKQLKEVLSKAKDRYAKYLQTGEITDNLIEEILLLSQFDLIFRSHKVYEIKNNVDKNDVKDLRNLLLLLEKRQNRFISKETCLLNPTFGEASRIIGGADADLVIDDIIIDIKTTTKADFNRDQFNQIMGYYLLSLIGGIDDVDKKHKINKVGIYYSRFGELLIIQIKDLLEEDKMNSFLKWFKKEIENINKKSMDR